MSDEKCPLCKDWAPDRFAGYRAKGAGCPKCGDDGTGRDLITWLWRQVAPDLRKAQRMLARWPGNPRWLECAAGCEAKVALLDAYAAALSAEGGLGYSYRMGRASEAQVLWRALRILAGGYRHREGWRKDWFMPQDFEGY